MAQYDIALYSVTEADLTGGRLVTNSDPQPTVVTVTDNDRNPEQLDDGSGNGRGTGAIEQTFSGTIDGITYTDSTLNIETSYAVFDATGARLGNVFSVFQGNLTGEIGLVSDFELEPDTEYFVFPTSRAPEVDPSLLYVCFTAGTLIETAAGPRPIEDLGEGDLVRTADNGVQPVRWIGSRRVMAQGAATPVRFRAGSFGLKKDILLSPQHRVLVQGWQAEALFGSREVLVAARDLLSHDRVYRDDTIEHVEYFHFMFDRHEIVFAGGMAAESLCVSDPSLSALGAASREEIFEIFPELRSDVSHLARPARPMIRAQEAALLPGV